MLLGWLAYANAPVQVWAQEGPDSSRSPRNLLPVAPSQTEPRPALDGGNGGNGGNSGNGERKKFQLPQGIGTLTGAFQSDMQVLFRDDALNTPRVPEQFLNNSYLNLSYSNRNFSAGVRFEAYLPPLLGFDERWRGIGLSNRYISFKNKYLTVTAGNFYEQYGSGMLLRAYWEPLLGIDNSIDGFQLQFTPYRGVAIKGLFGRQRNFFGFTESLVRGGDFELDFATLLDSLWRSPKTQFRIGGGVVSRFQRDQDPGFILPQNVASFAGRLYLAQGGWNLYAEYLYKINDPNATNNFIYRPGQALFITSSFSWRNLAVTVGVKRLDNVDFRTDRTATGIYQTTNFLPPLAKQHTYRLPTLYLYATQNNGEMGMQIDVNYAVPAGTKLGGKYGMNISANYSRVHGLDTTRVGNDEGYRSSFFGVGKRLYYQDFNIEITKRITKKLRMNLAYFFISYDVEQILNLTDSRRAKYVEAHAAVLEMAYKIKPKHSLRWEVQHMYAQRDFGSWLFLLLEYNLSPNWFFAVGNEWNYGNPDRGRRFHYPGVQAGFNAGGLRITLGYARQREGIVCVGGVCRVFPASNGLTASISATF